MQCEADAVAFTEEAQHGLQPPCELPITPGGSYVLAPGSMEADAKRLRAEVCMARPSSGPLAPRQRTRVVYNLRQQQGDGLWELEDVEVQQPYSFWLVVDIVFSKIFKLVGAVRF